MEFSLLYNYPIWSAALIIIFVLIIGLESGFRVGLHQSKERKDAEAGGGGVVLTSMFALMGLVLAFTYASGVSRYDARKHAVTAEANALGTAYLKADLLAEPGRTELKKVLLEYARTRTFEPGSIKTNADRKLAIDRTKEKLAQLWPTTKRIIDNGKPGPLEASLVAAINAVIDAHTTRIMALIDKLPGVVMLMLLFIMTASLAVAGYNAGIQGHISRWRMSAFALVLTGLLVVILDFDRPNTGAVIVTNYSIDAVIEEMENNL